MRHTGSWRDIETARPERLDLTFRFCATPSALLRPEGMDLTKTSHLLGFDVDALPRRVPRRPVLMINDRPSSSRGTHELPSVIGQIHRARDRLVVDPEVEVEVDLKDDSHTV